MTLKWISVAIGLLVGTYVVRAIPFWFSGIRRLPPRVQRFLDMVPGAALGALIVPDAFNIVSVPLAVTVLTLTFVLRFRGGNTTVVVLVAIAITWVGLLV